MDSQVQAMIKKTITDINTHKAVAINNKINEIMTNEVNPKIAENEKIFNDSWANAKQRLNEESEKLRAEGKQKATDMVEEEYKKVLDTLNLVVGEE